MDGPEYDYQFIYGRHFFKVLHSVRLRTSTSKPKRTLLTDFKSQLHTRQVAQLTEASSIEWSLYAPE